MDYKPDLQFLIALFQRLSFNESNTFLVLHDFYQALLQNFQIFVKFTSGIIKFALLKMFKSSNQSRAKSPYQPKLLQALIDSSDDDDQNLSMSSDDNYQQFTDQQDQFFQYKNQNKSRFSDPYGVQDKKSVKSVYTTLSQQTVKAKNSSDFNLTKNPKHQKQVPSQNPNSKPQTLNLTRFTQKNQPKPSAIQESSVKQLSQKPQSSHSPVITIKYDTLNLSQYGSQEIKKQEQLYEQNMKEFKEKFTSLKFSQKQKQIQKDKILIEQGKQEVDDYIDSLEAMKRSNLNRRHFSRKSLKNQHSTPSSRIKLIQQQRQPNSNQKQQNFQQQFQSSSETQRLRQELKRSKDIIKTLSLKNSDLQKTLEMKNTQLMQIESQENSRLTQMRNKKERQCTEKKVYDQINLYMKQRVKDFMNELNTMKMSPLLQQSLEDFLAQILQLNQVTVNKRLGISQPEQKENEELKECDQNITPNRLSKSIFNTKSEINQKQEAKDLVVSIGANQFRNRFQSAYPQNHISIGNRQNAFMGSKDGIQSGPNIKGITVKVDLSSNKENITPNKRVNNDEDFRQLQKSLQKLRTMEKELSTPAYKSQFITNKSHIVSNNDEYRTEYSIINRSHFSGLAKEENNSMNISSNNLDRSKSRRKKIFAQTNQK